MNWLTALFTNSEDGLDGDAGWQADNKSAWWFKHTFLRRAVWWARNPFHDFCFHCLGFSGEFGVSWHGRFNGVFASDAPDGYGHAFNWGYCERIGGMKYPFISYEGSLGRGYIGWRKGGAFAVRPPVKGALIACALGLLYRIL